MSIHDVTRFGAVQARESTAAIAAAIAAAQPGDTVLVPSGQLFFTRPINVSKSIILQVDGTLRSVTADDVADGSWPLLPPLPTYGRDRDGAKPRRHQALLLLYGARNVIVRGSGSLDGAGPWWWNARHSQPHAGRPHLIEVYDCEHVEIADVTLRDAAFWTLHLYHSRHVHVHDVRVVVQSRPAPRAPPPAASTRKKQATNKKAPYEGMWPLYAPNTDGIDADSSQHVLIERCDISCGDDHIAIKSGMNAFARAHFPAYSAENVTVRHNVFRSGMGVAVGSETAGGVRHVRVHHNTFWGDGGFCVALHLKSAAQRGGVIEDIAYSHNRVRNATALMRLASFGRSQRPTEYAPTTIRDVVWSHNVLDDDDDERGRQRHNNEPLASLSSLASAEQRQKARRVRSKFLCPTHSTCTGVRVCNNSLPPTMSSTWQCVGVRLDDDGMSEDAHATGGGATSVDASCPRQQGVEQGSSCVSKGKGKQRGKRRARRRGRRRRRGGK